MGFPENTIKIRICKAASDMEVESLLGRSIFNLSGGEKQKGGMQIKKNDWGYKKSLIPQQLFVKLKGRQSLVGKGLAASFCLFSCKS